MTDIPQIPNARVLAKEAVRRARRIMDDHDDPAVVLASFLAFVEQSPSMSPRDWREAIEGLG